MNYYERARACATRNTDPTMTDQAGANDTDINVIVRRMGVGGALPGNTKSPMYGDFTGLPPDLRGFLESADQLRDQYANLPAQLRNYTPSELLNLTTTEMVKILNPDHGKPPKEEPK